MTQDLNNAAWKARPLPKGGAPLSVPACLPKAAGQVATEHGVEPGITLAQALRDKQSAHNQGYLAGWDAAMSSRLDGANYEQCLDFVLKHPELEVKYEPHGWFVLVRETQQIITGPHRSSRVAISAAIVALGGKS